MAKWKCEICGNEFENFHAQGFDRKIYCPLCYFKKKYENAVSDYETTMFEKEQLNSLVNSCQEEIRRLKKQLTTYQILLRDCKADNLKNISKIEEIEYQQKEFIKYMNDIIEDLETEDVDDEEMKGYLIQRIDTFKEILQKYKEIIGSDINVGSIGVKDE